MELITFGRNKSNRDFAAFSEAYSVPHLNTEYFEFVIDGCQYKRNQKTEKISDWKLAQKYLNVCGLYSDATDSAHNCSKYTKCLRTLFALDAMGKLEKFASVFDIDTYRETLKLNAILSGQNLKGEIDS